MKAVVGFGIVASLAAAAMGYAATSDQQASSLSQIQHPSVPEAVPLGFRELITSDAGTMAVSERARMLANRRVRMTGYVAKLELPPQGAFYLTAVPVRGDESGAGTGDLPPDAVLVETSALARNALESIEGPVEVSGLLALSHGEDSEGRAHRVRLLLDAAISK